MGILFEIHQFHRKMFLSEISAFTGLVLKKPAFKILCAAGVKLSVTASEYVHVRHDVPSIARLDTLCYSTSCNFEVTE